MAEKATTENGGNGVKIAAFVIGGLLLLGSGITAIVMYVNRKDGTAGNTTGEIGESTAGSQKSTNKKEEPVSKQDTSVASITSNKIPVGEGGIVNLIVAKTSGLKSDSLTAIKNIIKETKPSPYSEETIDWGSLAWDIDDAHGGVNTPAAKKYRDDFGESILAFMRGFNIAANGKNYKMFKPYIDEFISAGKGVGNRFSMPINKFRIN